MGYKLAGFEVIGAVEIDKQMAEIYVKNHKPKYLYRMAIQEFNKLTDLPEEFFNLDILDGSPPCSSFSMAGSRENKWGGSHKFREGQANQKLDDLFFHFIETAGKLKPKVVIAENVKGLIQGNAKGYVKEIFNGFKNIGYDCQLFLLNASVMGVPQRRERTFFIANRMGKKIFLKFNEPQIPFEQIKSNDHNHKACSKDQLKLWEKTKPGYSFSSVHPKKSWFNSFKIHPNLVAPTVTASARASASGLYHHKEPRHLSCGEYRQLQTFPEDFGHLGMDPVYIYGMSVPPFMMQRLADQIYKQFFGGQ